MQLRMDIFMPSLRAVPHFSSSRGSCKYTDKYPHSALRGSSWGCCQQNHWSWCFLMAQPLNGVHLASELAVVLQVQVTNTSVCVCVCEYVCVCVHVCMCAWVWVDTHMPACRCIYLHMYEVLMTTTRGIRKHTAQTTPTYCKLQGHLLP